MRKPFRPLCKLTATVFLALIMTAVPAAGTPAAAASLPESAHPYANSADETWSYEYPGGAEYLKITFSADTKTEYMYDWITITDAAGTEIRCGGDMLSGKSLYLKGSSFTIRLTSDQSGQEYGFRFTSIESIGKAEYDEPHYLMDGSTLVRYTGNAQHLVIPSSIDGHKVTAINESLFKGNEALQTVVLPDTLTYLGTSAFEKCVNLEQISVPESLESMGFAVFSGCSSLQEITLPENLTVLQGYEFMNCTSLRKVTLSSKGTDIGPTSFWNCENLRVVEGPIKSMSAEGFPFFYCNSLTSVEFADSMTALPDTFPGYLADLLQIVVTVGQNSVVYPQLRDNDVCYVVRETGETNVGSIPVDTVRGKMEYVIRTCITDGMSDYEKVKALHDWLCRNAEYDNTFTNYGADGVLLKGTGVCQSYTDAFRGMLGLIGIENATETGDDHIWNMVCLDGEWYHIDVTWDDNGDEPDYDFFCVTNYALEGIESHECFTGSHYASAYEYNYFYHEGLLDQWIENSRAAITQSLGAGQSTFTFNLDLEYWGIRNKTVVLALRDQTYAFSGVPVQLDFSLETQNYQGIVTASVLLEEADFVLPAAMDVIEDEAFMNTAVTVVSIPDGVSEIGERAFADCAALRQIYIPASCTQIAESAFENDAPLLIICESGSTAAAWAQAHGYAHLAPAA